MDLEIVKTYLKIDTDEEDQILNLIIEATSQYIESSLDNEIINKALKEATMLLFIGMLYNNRGINEGKIDDSMKKIFDGLMLKLKTENKGN